MEIFAYKRKALHLFSSRMVVKTGAKWFLSSQCFRSLKISLSSLCNEVKRARRKANPGIGRMWWSDYMQPWLLNGTCMTLSVINSESLWAHSTMSVSSLTTGRRNIDPYMTYLTKILWFCRFTATFERCEDHCHFALAFPPTKRHVRTL